MISVILQTYGASFLVSRKRNSVDFQYLKRLRGMRVGPSLHVSFFSPQALPFLQQLWPPDQLSKAATFAISLNFFASIFSADAASAAARSSARLC